MARIKVVRGKASITTRNARYYLAAAVPYISLLVSIAALLKAYNVVL